MASASRFDSYLVHHQYNMIDRKKLKPGTCWILTLEDYQGKPSFWLVRVHQKPQIRGWTKDLYLHKKDKVLQIGTFMCSVPSEDFKLDRVLKYCSITKDQFKMLWNLAEDKE